MRLSTEYARDVWCAISARAHVDRLMRATNAETHPHTCVGTHEYIAISFFHAPRHDIALEGRPVQQHLLIENTSQGNHAALTAAAEAATGETRNAKRKIQNTKLKTQASELRGPGTGAPTELKRKSK